ncbi:MAG TPA: ABC transporter substrate-binding protein [Candidatus Limnocylindrales bacterium]|nr:ABC transporter substrate-binding protein [Candidatus Limnocylindrales bacterium]
MFQATRIRLLASLVASALLAAACAGGGATTPPSAPGSPSPAASAAQSPSPEPGALPTPELTTIRIGLSVAETSQFAAQLAHMTGIFDRLGLETEVTVFEGDGKTMQALQAGQLEFGFVGVSSAITSQTTDAPVAIISVNAQVLSDQLVTLPDIKSADDLRGKCVAVSTFGGTSHGAVLLSLQALGLTPQDVVITEIGGQAARIAALQGGACAAAPVDASREQEMRDLGFNILVDLKEEGLPWGRSGAGVREDWLAENRNTAIVVEAGVLEAQNMFWADPDTAAENYAEFAQLDLETAKALVADFQEIGNRTMMWDDEAFENPKRVLATVNPDIESVDVSDAYDRSILQTLADIGYYEKLGIPLP